MTAASVDTPLRIDALRTARAHARFGRTLHYFDSVDSTNTVAHQLAAEGAAEGTAVIAETQTKGRGRLGRTWSSPAFRNVYLSIILRPPITASTAPQIALVAGLAATEAVQRWAPHAAVKWPNDVVVDRRKIVGILTELEAEGDRVRFVILGIGVNINSTAEDFPAELRDKVIGLRTTVGSTIDRVEFTDHLLARLEEHYDLYLRRGFAAIRPLWERHSYLTGRDARIDTAQQRVEGTVTGLADDGCLLLRTATGEEIRVVAGDVSVVDGYD